MGILLFYGVLQKKYVEIVNGIWYNHLYIM